MPFNNIILLSTVIVHLHVVDLLYVLRQLGRYWEFILTTRCWALTNIRNVRNQIDGSSYEARKKEAIATISKAQALKKAKKKKEVAAMSVEIKTAEQILSEQPPSKAVPGPDELVTRLKSQVCGAMYRIYLALNMMGVKIVEKNMFPFGPDWHGRFQQRFAAFAVIPYLPMMTYDRFLQDAGTTSVVYKRISFHVSMFCHLFVHFCMQQI